MERVETPRMIPVGDKATASETQQTPPPSPAAALRLRRISISGLVLPFAGMAVLVAIWAMVSQLAPFLPNPVQTITKSWDLIRHPFFDEGPNNKGIGWQVLYSLGRVGLGFGLAILVGIPAGLILGLSAITRKMWDPVVQVLKPVSPLAWLPLGLATFQAATPAAVFTIFITALWPILINTSAGVQQVPLAYLQVGRILRLSRRKMVTRILIPAALPHILSGLRVSLGVAWLVIVASEMLTGGGGIGFFVWDEWNNLSLEHIILAIAVIGLVGLGLDRLMLAAARRISYQPLG
ncbi:MAG: nitrate ABC transporter permease [Nitrospirota bacterium]